jgi:hypothetical protein|tara:strand:- start:2065 stop:2517 length:453 start_codon:yes stop_codon:yes gene_type:complete
MADERRRLTQAEAQQFAQIVLSGAPIPEAVRYFWDVTLTEDQAARYEQAWPRQPEVVAAVEAQSGGAPWHLLTDGVRWERALQKHYNELAYFLWTTNYAECVGAEKIKADTCRAAMEAKVAGMAGRESPLATFYHELLARSEQAETVAPS